MLGTFCARHGESAGQAWTWKSRRARWGERFATRAGVVLRWPVAERGELELPGRGGTAGVNPAEGPARGLALTGEAKDYRCLIGSTSV